jgi:hypothetical protein
LAMMLIDSFPNDLIGTESDKLTICPGYLQKPIRKAIDSIFRIKWIDRWLIFYSVVFCSLWSDEDKWKDVEIWNLLLQQHDKKPR